MLEKKRDVGTGSVGMTEPEKITSSSTADKHYVVNCRRLSLLFQMTLKPWCWHISTDPNNRILISVLKKDW